MKLNKLYLAYLLIGSILLSFTSCNSLNLYPEDYYGGGNFWKSESQVEGYISGLHAELRDKHFLIYQLGEERGGTLKSGTSFMGTSLDDSSPIKTNQFTKDLTGVQNWGGLYANILRINLLLKILNEDCEFLSSSKKAYFLGQAYGLRAYYYFLLYRTFGGVPLAVQPAVMEGITDASTLYLPRSSAKTTLDFIKNNIKLSEEGFKNTDLKKLEKCIWSKDATLMLKAEVYLWSAKVSLEDWTANPNDATIASEALDIVLSKYQLLEDYKSIFNYKNKENDEIIFSLRFIEGEASNKVENFMYQRATFANLFYDRNGKLMGDTLEIRSTGLFRHEYKLAFYNSFDDTDTRKETTFLDCYYEDGSQAGVILRKFPGIVNSTGNKIFCDDYIIYRCADAILMKAEIANLKKQDISSYINEIRRRAYGKSYDVSIHAYQNSSFAENELAILQERDKEFVFEGKRWFDLVRLQGENWKPLAFSPMANYGETSSLISEKNAYMLLWPIDTNTLKKDPQLINNPGYEK